MLLAYKIKKEKMQTFLLVIFIKNIFFTNVAQFQDISIFLEAVLSRKKEENELRKAASNVQSESHDHTFEEFRDKSEFNDDQVDPESRRPVEQFKGYHAFELWRTFLFRK